MTFCTRSAAGLERRIIDQVPTIDESDARISAWQQSLRTGWTNPYLSM